MRKNTLFDNIKTIYKKIAHAAMKAGRSPEEITLIAVSKNVESRVVHQAIEIGLRDFGENRVQEAKAKISELGPKIPDSNVRWHLIGHLQKNKVKAAVHLFDLIHSVDSVELADRINSQARNAGKIQNVLIQVKLSDDEGKYGIKKDNLMQTVRDMAGMKYLLIQGLMTMPPYFDEPERTRPFFTELRRLKNDVEKSGIPLTELSMGMSGDFEVAIEEGATMVRIGTALFGERTYT